MSGSIGTQAAVAGGGRYDGLVKSLGGPDVPGVGFACGMELALMMGEGSAAASDFIWWPWMRKAAPRAGCWRKCCAMPELTGEMNFSEGGFKGICVKPVNPARSIV